MSLVNPSEGYFLCEIVPPAPWPLSFAVGTLLEMQLDNRASLRVSTLPGPVFQFDFQTAQGTSFKLTTCPLTFSGKGYFRAAIAYSGSGATIFAGGQCVASNEPGQNPAASATITLKQDEDEGPDATEQGEFLTASAPTLGLFDAARAKLGRGNEHIANFNDIEQAFWKRKPYVIVKEANLDGTTYSRIVRMREHLPPDIALIIGDAVHNLRAALDLLAVDLVRANGRSTSSVHFPFSEDEGALEHAIKRWNVNRASPEAVDMIRSLQPYKGGNSLLRGLHDLDVADKHKLIIPVVGLAQQPTFEIDFMVGASVVRPENTAIQPVNDGTVLDAHLPADFQIDNKTSLFSIAFADETPFAHHGVAKTLEDLSKLVDGIIETFASHVLGDDTGD